MKVLGIIPARYHSSRLEGKPLADICDKPMIQRVYEQAKKALDEVVVATDDQRIVEVVQGFGGQVIMTSSQHNTGTNRCLEGYQKSGIKAQIIINIQGDEPLLEPEQLHEIIGCFDDDSVDFATLAFTAKGEKPVDGNGVYVVLDNDLNAICFSRSVIPHVGGKEKETWGDNHQFYKHVGMYAYTPKALAEFSKMEQTLLEKAESLEQLRWLENGNKIRVSITKHETIAVDTPQDLERVRQLIQQNTFHEKR
ncbi:MAG: 3-deoxy-manno-octulosonate cytidylyltransferase [Flavobacteriales bacterium]|nr:3-deoxy-manno-octulosonate cytidylyltransferase [Flavobacteriales bacterium]